MPRVTSADVARESGVSRTTVSYVLNDKHGAMISADTRERVLAAATRLGYSPSAAARTLRSGRSDLVLCVLPNWTVGPVLDTVLDELTRELADRQLSVLVHHGRGPRPLTELWRAVTPRAVVGFTAFGAEDADAMRGAGIQVLNASLDDDPHAVFAVPQTRVGQLQVRHLADTGHVRLGWAAPAEPRLADFAERRLSGVRAECARRGLAAPVVREVDLDVGSATHAVRAWRGAGVTAVAAYNDEVALAVLAGARACGLVVPGQLAVVGVDDVPAARLSDPALTTVAQDAGVQARAIAAAVAAALDGGTPPPSPDPTEVLRLVVRGSA
ncbi:LacI family DNA-binding transcriptional regulator [Modestobacter sp. VKM Ac-2984]|uniref:LacI family DNA-binding transcriptional regulator n=1 Tax=Modestobacter sp. VKM Ac-2984 TaxID=3004138 RepID=UPI0022AAFE55|nr:LacI family DNA-binding transcriptional regulator [Modestobacter sp. VKM Ac-2984]MCZ2815070.1 LacI family DNA-binding transcriptional regulator [Modestobacter sp. VKM Ac-2984]